MGSGSSKKVVRANSLQKKLNRPFPRVIEELFFTNSHSQFVALVCKTNNVARKFVPSHPEYILPFTDRDNEGESLMSVETHDIVNLDLQSGILLKEKISEEHKAAERESEENKPTEEDKTEIINAWEIMEGLDDGETCHVSKKTETDMDTIFFSDGDICQELIYQSPPTRISRRSKSPESFHTVEEYDAFLDRKKGPLWNRKSKRYLYYLGHDHLNKFRSTSRSRLSLCTQLSLQGRKMAPIVIDWKEDSKDEDDSNLEFPVFQPSFELKDMKHNVHSQENKDIPLTVSENNSREENNGIAQTVSENNGSQENNHSLEANIGNINMVETNSEKDQSLETNSSKKRMQVRDKRNDLGDIIIPSAPDFSAVVSFKDWLNDGGHLHSPAETTVPRFGFSGFGDIWSKLNVSGSSDQPSSDEAELETYSFPVLSVDSKFANNGESSIYFGSADSAMENKPWDHPPFDPELLELLALLDKDLQQLSQEEQQLLRQIDGDSNLLCGKFCAKGDGDVLQDSSGTEDTHMQSTCPYKEEEFFIQAP